MTSFFQLHFSLSRFSLLFQFSPSSWTLSLLYDSHLLQVVPSNFFNFRQVSLQLLDFLFNYFPFWLLKFGFRNSLYSVPRFWWINLGLLKLWFCFCLCYSDCYIRDFNCYLVFVFAIFIANSKRIYNEVLCEFFNAMVVSIWLLRLKGQQATLSKFAKSIESLTGTLEGISLFLFNYKFAI